MKELFSKGHVVLFQGDSVTDCGRNRDGDFLPGSMGRGYPKIFTELYNSLFPENGVSFVNRGVSGDRIRDLLSRYDEDFKAVSPDFISIMVGINDTWRAFSQNDPCQQERFEREYRELLERLKRDFPKAKLLMIEQFAFEQCEGKENWGEDLSSKRAVTKKLAEEYADYFVPMYSIMQEHLKSFTIGELSEDGVHPNPKGHALIAAELVKALEII